MNKKSRIVSFFVAVVMIMSLLSVSVSAAPTTAMKESTYVAETEVNLLEVWGNGEHNFESGANYDSEGTFIGGDYKFNHTKPLYGWTTISNIAIYALSDTNIDNGKVSVIQNEGTNGSNAGKFDLSDLTVDGGPTIAWIPLEPGFKYVLSVDAKIDSADTATSATVSAYASAGGTNKVAIDNKDVLSDSTLTKDYKHFEFLIETSASGKANPNRQHVHIGFTVPQSSGIANIITDNWSLVKKSPLAVQSKTSNGAEATFTFNHALKNVTASNFEVTPSGATVTPVVEGNVCKVRLSNVTYNADYTVTAKNNITDIYNQTLSASDSITFNTGDEPDVLGKNGFDGSYETVTAGEFIGTNANTSKATLRVVNDSSKAYEGSQYLEIVTTGEKVNTQRLDLVDGLNIGSTYVVSYYAKAAASGQKIKTALAVTGAFSVNNTVCDLKPISDTEWTKMTDYFTVSGELNSNNKVRVTINVEDAGTVYLDNFTVYPMTQLVNTTYFAHMSKGADYISVDITDGAETAADVYVMAAKYDNTGKLVDVKLGEPVGDTSCKYKTRSYKISGAGLEDYKLFIWNKEFAPLHTITDVSDI